MANSTDKSILTAAGKALLAQLNAEEKALVIDKMIFANVPNRPEYPQPDDVVPTDHIVHQEQVEQRGRLSADSVIYSTTLTSDVGPFDFNWTGAYCSEYGVLVTIDHHALTPKTADEPGVAGNTLVRSVVLEYKDIAEITNITVDASSWQYNATERMKKMDSDVAQSIIDQNGKDWFIEDGFLVTPSGSAYSIKAGAGYVSGNRVAMEFDRSVQVPNKPSFIYIDAHREGTPTGEQVTLFNFVVTAEEKDDYIDSSTGKDVKHFVCKIAQVHADGSVSDLRPEGDTDEVRTEVSDLISSKNRKNWSKGVKIKARDKAKVFTHPNGKLYVPNKSKIPFVTSDFDYEINNGFWEEFRIVTPTDPFQSMDGLTPVSLAVRLNTPSKVDARLFGIVDDYLNEDGTVNKNPTDNTLAMQLAVDYAFERWDRGGFSTVIDFNNAQFAINERILIKSGYLTLQNGQAWQQTDTEDAIQFDGTLNKTGAVLFVEFNNFATHKVGKASETSGSLVRNVAGTLGWFTWRGSQRIMGGGRCGFINGFGSDQGEKKGGSSWEINLKNLWFDSQFESAVYWPSNGGEINYNRFDGGSTTFSMRNVHATNIVSHTPAYQLGNGIDHVTLQNVTADYCTKLLAVKAKSVVIENIAMEKIKAPNDLKLKEEFLNLPTHDLVFLGQSTHCELNGFTINFSDELKTSPHEDTNGVYANAITSNLSGISGAGPNTMFAVTVAGAGVEAITTAVSVNGAKGSRALYGASLREMSTCKSVSIAAKNNTFDLFPVDPISPRAYLITIMYNYLDKSVMNTFIVHTSGQEGGLKGNAVKLLGSVDNAEVTLVVENGKVTATVPSTQYHDWSAIDLISI
ncbi:phage tail-collar fiber domain-containing protein [Vibrio parahaemolyticus]|uniref:phage tail-collar fiber domain-containing protein n=1 Tax=Vibrio parahaemolyticus TaxID=670 RepID=UPI001D158A93|nr:phage tail protein [Vibrio parahaemolyticus]